MVFGPGSSHSADTPVYGPVLTGEAAYANADGLLLENDLQKAR